LTFHLRGIACFHPEQCYGPCGSEFGGLVKASVLLVGALTAAILALGFGCSRPTADHPGPSVVLITLDTTRADRLPFNGYDRDTAPNLRRLADESLVFRNFVNVSSWTLPAHASLFTGLYPTTHTAHYSKAGDLALSDAIGTGSDYPFFRANRLPEEAVTLPEVLRDEGYSTFGVGSGPWMKEIFGLAQGFDEYDAATTSTSGRAADEVNALALSFLRREHERPFFMFLNYFDPHDPYTPPPALRKRFADPYDGEIAYMDLHIGEVLDELRRRELYDRSWIFVTSDHGEHFGEHGIRLHGFSLYQGVLRGILLIKPPAGIRPLLDPLELCQHVDVMPTVLQQLGIQTDHRMEGHPIGSIGHPAVAELFESEGNVRWKGKRFARHLRAVYWGSHKLIVSSRPGDRDSGLFDLEADPGELVDLSERDPEVLQELTAKLQAWKASLLPRLDVRTVEAVDRKTREQLERLGYLETDTDSKAHEQ
jgi:arylsulfatase A-like enzyme